MHYVSATKPNRLMLFRKTVTVYCENHTEHTNTLCGQKTQSVPHRKHHVSATKPNRLMLFRETVAVYCENHTEQINSAFNLLFYPIHGGSKFLGKVIIHLRDYTVSSNRIPKCSYS
jgi:predicted Zn-dependent protease with MMP-like domain